MKRNLILLFVLLFFIVVSHAQKINYGIKGGINSSNLNNETYNSKALLGFHAGVFAEVKLLGALGVQPEILYSTQGTKFDDLGEVDLNYVNVPVMVKLHLIEILYLEAGPQFGFLINSDNDFLNKSDFKTFDMGVGLGAGVTLFEKIGVGARYVFGISDVNDYGAGSLKNGVFQVSVCYIF